MLNVFSVNEHNHSMWLENCDEYKKIIIFKPKHNWYFVMISSLFSFPFWYLNAQCSYNAKEYEVNRCLKCSLVDSNKMPGSENHIRKAVPRMEFLFFKKERRISVIGCQVPLNECALCIVAVIIIGFSRFWLVKAVQKKSVVSFGFFSFHW